MKDLTTVAKLPLASPQAIDLYMTAADKFISDCTALDACVEHTVADHADGANIQAIVFYVSRFAVAEYLAQQDGFTTRDWSKALPDG